MSNPLPNEDATQRSGNTPRPAGKPTTPRRRWWLGVLGGLAVLAGMLVIEHFRGEANLRAWREAMRAKGEPLTVAELLPPLPPGRTPLPQSAIVKLLRLEDLQPLADASYGPGFLYLAPGQVRSVWAEPDAEPTPWGTNTWKHLEAVLAQVSEPLGALREHLARRTWTVAMENPSKSELPTSMTFSLISASIALRGAVQVELHRQRLDAALEHLLALLALPEDGLAGRQSVGHVGFLAMHQIAIPATWQALQATGWTDAPLAALQTAWERKWFLEETALGLAAERASTGAATFDKLREDLGTALRNAPHLILHRSMAVASVGAPSTPDQGRWQRLGSRAVELAVFPAGIAWRVAWLDQDELHYCRSMQEAIERVRLIAAERSVAAAKAWAKRGARPVAPFRSAARSLGESGAALDRVRYCASQALLPKLESLVAAACELETLRSMVVAAVALKRHELRHGGLPADLAALVPEFLAAVPVDYQDGKPIRYHARADGTYLLYSVGDDGQDDGGVAAAAVRSGEPPKLTGGRDWVWPVATAR